MSYAESQGLFQTFRARLEKAGLAPDEINQWLKSPHAKLDGLSPARCLHCGKERDVDALITKLEEK